MGDEVDLGRYLEAEASDSHEVASHSGDVGGHTACQNDNKAALKPVGGVATRSHEGGAQMVTRPDDVYIHAECVHTFVLWGSHSSRSITSIWVMPT